MSIREFILFGRTLNQGLPIDIRRARELEWPGDSIERIIEEAEKYFMAVARYIRLLSGIVLVPGIFVMWFLARGALPYWIAVAFSVVVAIAAAAASMLLFLAGTVVAILSPLPEPSRKSCFKPLLFSAEILHTLTSASLVVFVLGVWEASTTIPMLVIGAVLWILVPWFISLYKNSSLYIKVRAVQFLSVLVAAFAIAASPVPMSHFQSWGQRSLAERFRPEEQQEITGRWRSLQWFSQEGAPLVWYSRDGDGRVRLFAAPGHNPDSNAKLRPVEDAETRDRLLSWFTDREREAAGRARLEADAAATARREAEAARREKEARKREEARAAMVARYVATPPSGGTVNQPPPTLIVFDSQRRVDTSMTAKVANAFKTAGVAYRDSVFTPAFVDSPVFSDLLSGRAVPDDDFPIASYAPQILAVEVSSTVVPQEPVAGVRMLGADTMITARVISSSNAQALRSVRATARGAGFRDEQARADGIEKAVAALLQEAPQLKPETLQ